MNKDNLMNFIQKYYLGNRVPSVMIKSTGKDLSCDFITADKSMLGNVKATGLGFGNEVVGVYDTETFLKMLSVMGDSIQLDVKKSGDKSVSITFTDGIAKSLFMLSDESVIPKVPQMKNVPEMKLKLIINTIILFKPFNVVNFLCYFFKQNNFDTYHIFRCRNHTRLVFICFTFFF